MNKTMNNIDENSTVREVVVDLVDSMLQLLLWSLSILSVFLGLYWMYHGHPYTSKIPFNEIWDTIYFHFVGDTIVVLCFMVVLICGYNFYIKVKTLYGLIFMLGFFMLTSHIYFHLPFSFYP